MSPKAGERGGEGCASFRGEVKEYALLYSIVSRIFFITSIRIGLTVNARARESSSSARGFRAATEKAMAVSSRFPSRVLASRFDSRFTLAGHARLTDMSFNESPRRSPREIDGLPTLKTTSVLRVSIAASPSCNAPPSSSLSSLAGFAQNLGH